MNIYVQMSLSIRFYIWGNIYETIWAFIYQSTWYKGKIYRQFMVQIIYSVLKHIYRVGIEFYFWGAWYTVKPGCIKFKCFGCVCVKCWFHTAHRTHSLCMVDMHVVRVWMLTRLFPFSNPTDSDWEGGPLHPITMRTECPMPCEKWGRSMHLYSWICWRPVPSMQGTAEVGMLHPCWLPNH